MKIGRMLPEKGLTELFDAYIKECQFISRLRFETIKGYREAFKLFRTVMPEITEPSLLSTEIMTEYFMRLQTRQRIIGRNTLKYGLKNSTIATYWSKLNVFFAWLHRKSIIRQNPLTGIKPPEKIFEDQQSLTNADVHKLYSTITAYSQRAIILRRDTVMVSLLLFCGLRLGEFISIQIRDIDFDKRLLTVRAHTSKSLKTRYIPIHPTLLFHLRDYINERNRCKYTSEYLVVSTIADKQLSRHGLKNWVNNLSRKSGVKFHLHRFRHTFACNLAQKDVNAVKIQKLLGHSSLDMTMTYLRSISTEDLQNEINRLTI